MGKIDLHLSIDAALLRRAEAAGVDPSHALEDALTALLEDAMHDQRRPFEGEGPEARAKRWAAENAEAIKEHNERIAERGLIGAEWRRW